MLDFGNGIVAGYTARDSVRVASHAGLEVPVAEVTFQEHGVLDGGTFVASRLTSRVMEVTMTTSAYTRREIAAAFRLGKLYTLTADRGAMPYVVEALSFASPNLRGPVRFTVALRSPDAYPVSAYRAVTSGSSSAMEWPHEWPHTYDSMTVVTSLVIENVGEVDVEPTFTLAASTTDDLTITVDGSAFTVAVTAGDAVVVDSYARTVTLNGVSAYGDMDIASVWPVLAPGANTVTFSQGVAGTVSWAERTIGLIG